MRGVILAGGLGTRLRPVTKIINKNLLLVYDKPLIYYPINTLKQSGIKDILIICAPEYADQYVKLLGEGEELGVKLSYTIQPRPLGIAHGLGLARHFSKGENTALILGDNIFGENFKQAVSKFRSVKKGANLILSKVVKPQRFGVAEFNKTGSKLIHVTEKPKNPKSNWIVAGLYFYDNRVFDVIDNLNPSARNEYEITDVNNFYIKEGSAQFIKTKKFWIDTGTFDSILKASILIRKMDKKIRLV